MVIARLHKGQLQDSMKTVHIFDTIEEMKQWFVDEYNRWEEKPVVSLDDIVIDSECRYDNRICWNTQYVCTKRFGKYNYIELYGCAQCIGMCDIDHHPKCNAMSACEDIGTKECAVCSSKFYIYSERTKECKNLDIQRM